MTDYIDPTELTDRYGDTMDDPLICVVTLTGDDYATAVDEINDNGGSSRAAVEYLAGWDYGTENDQAAVVNGASERQDVERWFPTEQITVNGTAYWFCADHPGSTYALYRRPVRP